MIKWSEMIQYLDQIHERWPSIWDLKLIKRPSRLIMHHLRPGMRILDVGASDRRMEQRIKGAYPDITYKSMDIDRGFRHDYYSLDDIDEQFDLITLLEVIEHIELEKGMELLGRLRNLLTPRGIIIISTPNIFHPNRFWQTTTHKVAYSYGEFAGFLLSKSFEVLEIYRTFNASVPKYFLRLTVFYPLHRILDVDFAKSIVFLAQKREKTGNKKKR